MLYNIVTIASDLFDIIVVLMFYGAFFEWKTNNVLLKLLCCLFMLSTIRIINHYILSITITLIGSLVIFFASTFWFKGTIKRKIFIVIGYILLVMICDLITTFIMTYFFSTDMNSLLNIEGNERMIAMFISKPIMICIVRVVSIFSNRNDIYIYRKYWILLFTIPIINMILLLSIVHLFDNSMYSGMSWVYIISLCVLYNTLFVFYLFDRIIKSVVLKNKCKMLENQVMIQSEEVKNNQNQNQQIQSIKHDLKLHMQIIYNLICNNQIEIAKKHLKSSGIVSDIYCNNVNSGNIALDSILNTKIMEADSLGIKTNISYQVPDDLKIEAFDSCSLFGNLFDNAIEGCIRSKADKKKIDIVLQYETNRLRCCIRNTASDNINKVGDDFLTSKKDKQQHGIGIYNIKEIIRKYDGVCSMECNNNVFTVAFTLFNV